MYPRSKLFSIQYVFSSTYYVVDIVGEEPHSFRHEETLHTRFDEDHKFALAKIWDKYYTFLKNSKQ
jgi:hypothetical protein